MQPKSSSSGAGDEKVGPDNSAAKPLAGDHLAAAAGRVKESVGKLPQDLRKKISFTIISCLVLCVVLLGVFYAMDYLDMSKAEKIIYRWHMSNPIQ